MNVGLIKKTFASFGEDKAPRLAAAIAYSTIFSIAPLFIVIIAIVGGILNARGTHGGHTSALNALLASVRHSAGPGAAATVEGLVKGSFNKPKSGAIAQILGWVFFVIGASGLFASLQDALNAVWHVEGTKGGWRQMVRARAASFAMIVVVGFLLLVTFVANAAISYLSAHVLVSIPIVGSPIVASAIDQVVSLAIITVIFALIFKILPDVKIPWRDVWAGAAATAVLFVVGEILIGIYIAKAGVESAYGAAGSLLVALVWIYYSALILLLGAEFTKVNASKAELTADSIVRHTSEQSRGVDPRDAAAAGSAAADRAATPPGDDAEISPVAAAEQRDLDELSRRRYAQTGKR
ncbi:MAG: YihY/virulence factor BrkB family protein [Vulcanimicrobiaceae bacterium]